MFKAWALEEGFDRVGVASLGAAPRGAEFLRWLERGDHADMAWMEERTELRLDPRRLLDGRARSAICVALQYHPLAGEGDPDGDLWPRVARYARGRDYHDGMGKRLRRLARRIETAFPGRRARGWVDTGPILERDLAAQAGLGAPAKNTHLLHPEGGSWFLLGEVLCEHELEPDPPLADLCGSCTRCLDACPTGALPEPYRLDARRCIAYWTIEQRGWIPEAMRGELEGWVFGCDICQEVCPWNQEAEAGDHPELALPGERAELELCGLLALDRSSWLERLRASPMKRPRLAGLRRNAALAMAHRRDPRYVPELARALADEDPLVRGHAAWALGCLGGAEARHALARARAREEEPRVARELDAALERIDGAAARG